MHELARLAPQRERDCCEAVRRRPAACLHDRIEQVGEAFLGEDAPHGDVDVEDRAHLESKEPQLREHDLGAARHAPGIRPPQAFPARRLDGWQGAPRHLASEGALHQLVPVLPC